MKYRKKPVTIEAIRLSPSGFWELPVTGGTPDFEGETAPVTMSAAEPKWFAEAKKDGVLRESGEGLASGQTHWTVRTLEGPMLLFPGDWLIKGVEDELYPCKNSIFEKTYEKVWDA